jgi:hypothetical protein
VSGLCTHDNSASIELKTFLCIVDEIGEKKFRRDNNFLDEQISHHQKQKCRCILRAAASMELESGLFFFGDGDF